MSDWMKTRQQTGCEAKPKISKILGYNRSWMSTKDFHKQEKNFSFNLFQVESTARHQLCLVTWFQFTFHLFPRMENVYVTLKILDLELWQHTPIWEHDFLPFAYTLCLIMQAPIWYDVERGNWPNWPKLWPITYKHSCMVSTIQKFPIMQKRKENSI